MLDKDAIRIIAREEFKDELEEIEKENSKLKLENGTLKNENSTLKNENGEYKKGIEKLKEMEDLNTPEAKNIINSLMMI